MSAPKATNPFYHTKEWGLARAAALARDNYLCQRCLERGFLQRAEMVHHVKPIETHPWLALVLDNLLSLCNACHNRVHREKPTKRKAKRQRRARIVKA